MPLLLVQVDSTQGSVERVREKLRRLGIQEGAISSHTADEPDANLLALAVDETKEVLIFKMAVALGFDAPRAFTLVSMRGSKDPDFGTQIVGRILRVHHKLQGISLPDLLKYGYVILADSESQEGIHIAAQKINAIKTQLTSVSPFTMLVKVTGQTQVQVVTNGQSSFLPVFEEQDTSYITSPQADSNTLNFEHAESSNQLALLDILTGVHASAGTGATHKRSTLLPEITATYKYNLKSGVPIRFWTQQFSAAEVDELVKCVTARIRLDDSILMAARTQAVDIIRSEQEIFDQQDAVRKMIRAAISLPDVEEQAQRVLLRVGYLNPQELQICLLERLKTEFETRGQMDIAESEDGLDHALSLIMVQHPGLLRRAEKECYADFTEVTEADPLPGYIFSDQPLQTSHLNIYGVMPADLNSWERDFAQMLDNDLTGTVKWWHRNPPLKPYSVRIVLPDGSAFFPDFVIGVKDRNRQDNILLAETKEAINRPKSILEAVGEHKKYGRALMVYWEERRRWMTVRYDEATDKNIVDSVFRVNLMPNY